MPQTLFAGMWGGRQSSPITILDVSRHIFTSHLAHCSEAVSDCPHDLIVCLLSHITMIIAITGVSVTHWIIDKNASKAVRSDQRHLGVDLHKTHFVGICRKEGSFWVPSVPNEMRVLNRSRQNNSLRVMLVLVHIDITPPHTPLPVFQRIGERTIPYSWRACKQLRHLCETALRSNGLFVSMFDGLVAFAVDRWRHDRGARRAVILAPDEGCVETSWKSAGGTDADTAIGNAGAQVLVKLLELKRLLELDRVTTLVSLSLASHDFRVSF
ncbi:uncharacterized protein TNCV_4205631 [Trichonephila clavipes]|nr:uncharacterized protein TNCV_4205631 [Trichonephila clavipes]